MLIIGETLKVVVRPSGTEPKLKCYLEARVPIDRSQGLAEDRRRARAQLHRIRDEMSLALGLGTAVGGERAVEPGTEDVDRGGTGLSREN